MRYYIRQHKDTEVQGPFSVEHLTAEIAAGRLSQNTLAASDLGEPIAQLRKWRRCDWFSLAEIPELEHLFPPTRFTRAEIDSARNRYYFSIACTVIMALAFIGLLITSYRAHMNGKSVGQILL